MANDKPINKKALLELKQYIPWLTGQQYKTLRGQILAGNDEAAMKGLQKILSRPSQTAMTEEEAK